MKYVLGFYKILIKFLLISLFLSPSSCFLSFPFFLFLFSFCLFLLRLLEIELLFLLILLSSSFFFFFLLLLSPSSLLLILSSSSFFFSFSFFSPSPSSSFSFLLLCSFFEISIITILQYLASEREKCVGIIAKRCTIRKHASSVNMMAFILLKKSLVLLH